MVDKEALGTCDNLSIWVAKATEEEMERLKSAYEIQLVQMFGESGERA